MSVPYYNDIAVINASATLSNGNTVTALPNTVTVTSDNPQVEAWASNFGIGEFKAQRLVAGPISANVTITWEGASVVVPVAFDGVPAVYPTALSATIVRTGHS